VPSAVPPSFGSAALYVTDGPGWSGRRPGPWRSALPCIAGALRRSLLGGACVAARVPFGPEAPGSIRRRCHPGLHQPPGLSADARRVLVPFTARLRDVGGVCGGSDGASSGAGRRPTRHLGVFTGNRYRAN
jgi:hypothetical protein